MFMKVRGYIFCLEHYPEGSEDEPLEEIPPQTTCYDSASYLQVVLSQGALPVIPPDPIERRCVNMMSIFTKSVIWWSASSTKLNIIGASSPDSRSSPSATWAF
jgi:hypothetical protein